MKFTINKRLSLNLVLSAFVILFLCVAFFLTKDRIQNTEQIFSPPSLQHPFGTDQFGRDMLLRSVHGFVYGFFVAFLINFISFLLGSVLGVLIGYYSGISDVIYSFVLNILMAFPIIPLLLVLIPLFGRGLFALSVIMIITDSILKTKTAKNETVQIKNSDYILNLKVLGAGNLRIVFCHLFPNVVKLIIPIFSMMLGHTILAISGMSFLGFGIQPPKADIGLLMNDSIRFITRAPWLIIFPGLMQVGIIIILNRLSTAVHCKMEQRRTKL